MKYVYILQSITFPEKFYVGSTNDLKRRMAEHNQGKSTHSNKYAPWRLKTYIAFSDEQQAFEFERYLKTCSGRAFAIKRL
jgi:predicted GIY-YIG superfamily endonuclease